MINFKSAELYDVTINFIWANQKILMPNFDAVQANEKEIPTYYGQNKENVVYSNV